MIHLIKLFRSKKNLSEEKLIDLLAATVIELFATINLVIALGILFFVKLQGYEWIIYIWVAVALLFLFYSFTTSFWDKKISKTKS